MVRRAIKANIHPEKMLRFRGGALFSPLFFALLPLVSLPVDNLASSAYAESLCRSEITYKWKKTQEEEEIVEHYLTLEGRGPDEASAKRALTLKLDREKDRARHLCGDQHEDLTGCIAGKLTALSGTLRGLGFAERKSIEEAVNNDCAARQGRCGEVSASEPACAEVIKAAGSSSSVEEKGKKDDKGKKK